MTYYDTYLTALYYPNHSSKSKYTQLTDTLSNSPTHTPLELLQRSIAKTNSTASFKTLTHKRYIRNPKPDAPLSTHREA